MENKWKIAFWICFVFLLLVAGFGAYSILDQGVALTYMKDEYSDTENDLNSLSSFINETDLSKTQIKKVLQTHHLSEYMDFAADTISLERVTLVFKEDKLIKVTNQW